MKVVVLAGGISTEREVSIVTGTMVCKALLERGHNAILLDVYYGIDDSDIFTKPYEIESEIHKIKSYTEVDKELGSTFFGPNVLELCKEADMVFMALHGENGENGKVQAAFDLMGIKYTGTGYLGSALAMDKGLAKQLFVMNQIPTPFGIVLHRDSKYLSASEYGLQLPCVVKPCCGGSSIGVSIVHTEDEFQLALKDAFSYEVEVVVEQFIQGREFSIGVIDNEALPIIEISPKEGFYDYKNKYEKGKTDEYCPADLSKELTKKMQDIAIEVHKILKLETYSRIDFLLDHQQNMYCLEANTLPGMTPTSLLPQEAEVIGLSFGDLCERLIDVSLSKYH